MSLPTPFLFCLGLCTMLVGCAEETRHLDISPQLMHEIESAPKRPIELSDAQKRDVVVALKGSKSGAAKNFDDPEYRSEVWASFWKSPLNNEVDRDRMIVVRYSDEGSYLYVGFRRDGKFFTDGAGQLYSDPPWSQ
jgi:hypothetical protein